MSAGRGKGTDALRATVAALGCRLGRWRAAVGARRLAALKRRRRFWLRAHLVLGLGTGAIFAVIGATGSILVFYHEIDEWLHPGLMVVAADRGGGEAAYLPLGQLVTSAERARPPAGRLESVAYPRTERHAMAFRFGVARADAVDAHFVDGVAHAHAVDAHFVFVDPYRGHVTGTRVERDWPWSMSHLIGFVFSLHYSLLAGETGGWIVGVLGMLQLVLLATGLIVWWPITGKWRHAFTLQRRGRGPIHHLAVHRGVGFYSVLVLGAVVLSGVYLNLPKEVVFAVRLLSPGTRDPSVTPGSEPSRGRAPLTPDQAVAIARQQCPACRLSGVALPEDEQGAYTISFVNVPHVSHFWSERSVMLDQYSGVVLRVADPTTRGTAGDTFLDWQWPLHSGQAFGWPGRIAVCVAGLVPSLLFVTGWLRWRRKRHVRPAHGTSHHGTPRAE